ncbi:type 4a pilus biogenesis protein PilO [Acinetobacter sp. HY1485]|uniref:type 4a pilus biogenesis protein PilO n=1 Tax=Acinetobacter sp. HY1485 TaxID=2970918 RepID=UPI0022B96AFF|nr:type 4a pilus biogenesis protein PilO [Acinetobacter sp. HY1485]
MSQDQFDELEETTKPAKKKLTFDRFIKQFNSLDPNNYGSWPLSVKITCWIFTFLFVCGLGYFVIIQSLMDDISNAQAEETNLLNSYRQKESTLRNLKQYQTQLATMQENFDQQLQQLPKESEIPGLVEDINVTGVNSGLKFNNIRLDPEVKQEFFIEQPISISATGNYHALGQFASDIAVLPRIVTLHDFTITATPNANKKSDIPDMTYEIKAKTYRYAGTVPDKKDQGA